MTDFCKIYCAGSVKAPYQWITSTPIGINRLVYINGGEGGYVKEGVEIPFVKDMLYFIPGNAHFINTYTSYATDDARLDHAYVNFELIPPVITNEVICVDPNEDEDIKAATEVFRTLCRECSAKDDFPSLSRPSQKYLKSTTIFLLDRIIEKFGCEVVNDKVIIRALRLMHENVGKHRTVSDIAAECFLSPDGFIRKFKRAVGETPYTYLKKLRVRTAQNMRFSGMKLNEIADKCGYADSSALIHAIESVEGK
jgi:AraC-like DNA-binding protein